MPGVLALSIAVAFFFGSALLHLLACNFAELPSYDVPPCSSIQSCVKATGLHSGANWYAQLVGRAWHYSNAAMKLYDSARELCSGELNLDAVPGLIAAATSKLAKPAQQAVYFADQSVFWLVQRIAFIDNELHRSGVSYVPYSDVRQYHSTTSAFLADLNSGVGRTPLSRAVLTYRSMNLSVRKLLLSAEVQMESIARISSRYGQMLWPEIPLAFPSLIVVTVDKILQSRYGGHDLINASVGASSSVFSAAAPFLNEYYSMLARYDSRAEDILKEARELKGEIYGLSTELETIGAPDFSPELLSLLPDTSSLRDAVIVQHPRKIPADARIRANSLLRSITRELTRYRLRDDNYFISLHTAEGNLGDLLRLKEDLSNHLRDYEALARGCHALVSKYKPRSSYVAPALNGYVALLKADPDLYACAEALRLMSLDKNYASDEMILESCEREISCGAKMLPDDYPCVSGDIEERISCCRTYRERKILDLKLSEAYAQYFNLRGAVESLLSYYDDPKAKSEYLELPTSFVCKSDLMDALSRATKLYLQLRKNASDHVLPIMDLNGYADSRTVSTLRIRFLLDAGGADLLVEYKLPFQILAYKNVSNNNLFVMISPDGKTATLRGSGWAEIEAQLMPVPLEIEELGSRAGYVHLHITNEKPIPVRHRISGKMISGSSNVHSDGKYVYFNGVGEAVVALRVVELNYVRTGDSLHVSVRNVGEYEYKGDVVIPYAGADLPKKCRSVGDVTLCSLRLNPFSEETVEIGGVFAEANDYVFFEDANISEPAESPLPPLEPPIVSEISAEQNAISSMNARVLTVLSELEKYYDRAVELNVTSLLPFSGESLQNLRSQLKDANDLLALNSMYAVAQDARSSLVARAKASVFSIPESEDVRQLAEKALVNDDYVLALALASAYTPKRTGNTGISNKHIAILLGLASLAALIYFLRGSNSKKRKKIPKI